MLGVTDKFGAVLFCHGQASLPQSSVLSPIHQTLRYIYLYNKYTSFRVRNQHVNWLQIPHKETVKA